MKKILALAAAVLAALAATVLAAAPASAATLREITGFGANPSNARMYLYVPDRVAATPAVVVGVHWCHGNALDFYNGTEYARLADRYGFIVIYPSVTTSDGCWDVHSAETLTHDGGGDSLSIVSMVKYVQRTYRTDPARTFVTGISSGAMMTNVLAGAYPDVFAAGSAFAGVPFGCFAGPDSWNSACANGQIVKTARQWGDQVRAAYPGYTGPRPRMQLWHGTTDDVLRFPNFGEEIKQWTDVLGVSQTPTSTERDTPRAGWTRTRYGTRVEAIEETGQPHNLQVLADEAIRFFGLDGTAPTSPPASSPAPPASSGPPSVPPASSGPPATASACRISTGVSAWNTGLTASVTISNTGAAPITNWSLAFALPSGQVITNGWGATYTPSGGAVTARNAGYNATIPPAGSTTIGFQATHTGDTGKPTAFALNGAACGVA